MYAYIKTRDSFSFYRSYPAISWDLPVASYQAATGSVVLRGQVPEAAKDMWLLFGGEIWTIDRVEPKAGLTTLTIEPAIDGFDRPLKLPSILPQTVGELIRTALIEEFRDQEDEVFALPYLRVSQSDNSPLVMSEVSDAGLFSLPVYIRSVQDLVRVSVYESAHALTVAITPADLQTHSITMDGDAELLQQTYSRQFTAKVTVVQSGSSTDFYTDRDGVISEEPPADRPRGEWRVVEARDNMEPIEAAREVFSGNVAANKIAFASKTQFSLGDIVKTRLEGQAASLKITSIRKMSSDNRLHYECGELQTSLSERLRAAESIETLGGVPASGGRVKGNLGVKGRLSAGDGVDVDGSLRANGLLILSDKNYGFELPTTNLEEGRLFFLIEGD